VTAAGAGQYSACARSHDGAVPGQPDGSSASTRANIAVVERYDSPPAIRCPGAVRATTWSARRRSLSGSRHLPVCPPDGQGCGRLEGGWAQRPPAALARNHPRGGGSNKRDLLADFHRLHTCRACPTGYSRTRSLRRAVCTYWSAHRRPHGRRLVSAWLGERGRSTGSRANLGESAAVFANLLPCRVPDQECPGNPQVTRLPLRTGRMCSPTGPQVSAAVCRAVVAVGVVHRCHPRPDPGVLVDVIPACWSVGGVTVRITAVERAGHSWPRPGTIPGSGEGSHQRSRFSAAMRWLYAEIVALGTGDQSRAGARGGPARWGLRRSPTVLRNGWRQLVAGRAARVGAHRDSATSAGLRVLGPDVRIPSSSASGVHAWPMLRARRCDGVAVSRSPG